MITSPQEFLALCASEDSDDLARSLADDAPLHVWEEVVSNFRSHHMDVAQNRTIPPEAMRLLIDRGDEPVRTILAKKRRLPQDLIRALSSDASPLVRKKIAANPKTPIEIVRLLAEDGEEEVGRVAMFRLKSA